ncbi:programmed cell death protein 7-like [Panicum virgatum]|uniref:programmed cell death protein 7-like n=1 Tax=Panicum virgatum TaxID=38727 RepID=UPI0019D6106E|nr:programmed cell death protein 7-like [Panicum virgatum]
MSEAIQQRRCRIDSQPRLNGRIRRRSGRGFLVPRRQQPGDGGFSAAASTAGDAAGGRHEDELRQSNVPPPPPEGPFGGPHAAVPSFGNPPPWPAAFGPHPPHPAPFPGNHPNLVGYGGYYPPPAAFGTNLPQLSPFTGVHPQLHPFAGQDPRFASFGGTPHAGHPFNGFLVNASSSDAAQGGEGSVARGRGCRSGRVPPSPGAGTSRTRSAARNAINIDDDGSAGHAEDDDNDDGSDDGTDNESSGLLSNLSGVTTRPSMYGTRSRSFPD